MRKIVKKVLVVDCSNPCVWQEIPLSLLPYTVRSVIKEDLNYVKYFA